MPPTTDFTILLNFPTLWLFSLTTGNSTRGSTTTGLRIQLIAILSMPSRTATGYPSISCRAQLIQRPPQEARSYVRNRRPGGSDVPVSRFSTGPGITQFALCLSIKRTGGTWNHSQFLNFSDKPAGQAALPFQGQVPPTPCGPIPLPSWYL